MKTFCTLICFLLFVLPAEAQQDSVFLKYPVDIDSLGKAIYSVDTILFRAYHDGDILIGTTVIPGTNNSMNLMNHGYRLHNIRLMTCDGGDVFEVVSRVNAVRETDSTLEVDVTITDNCCFNFLCDARIDEINVMHLFYTGYGMNCSCFCCFGLTYVFERWNFTNDPLIEAVMIADDKKSLYNISRDAKD